MKSKPGYRIKINPKELAKSGDFTEEEIRERKWRIPRLWRNGKKLLFFDYIIANDGIIIRIIKNSGTYLGRKTSIRLDRGGYLVLGLYLNKKRIQGIKFHRILWETWVDRIPKKLQINHKDGVKSNNDLKNLEVVTQEENMQHAKEL